MMVTVVNIGKAPLDLSEILIKLNIKLHSSLS